MACSRQCFRGDDLLDKVGREGVSRGGGERDFTVGRCSLLRGHVLQRPALRPRCGFYLVLVDALYTKTPNLRPLLLLRGPRARQT